MTLSLSFVMPTHNRGPLVIHAVESLRQQRFPADSYEIVVVNNASTDGSLAPVEAAARTDQRIRVINEPRLGASNARNAGWNAARAPVVVFVDDDITAPPDYATHVLRALESGAAAVGGKVVVRFPHSRPGWITDDLLEYLSEVDWQPHAGPLPESKWLVSCNLAVRREMLARVGGFRPDLGPVGRRWTVEEDVELQRQIRKTGGVCWYEPKMVVFHHISEGRLNRGWFLRRAFWGGFSLASASHAMGGAERSALRRLVAHIFAGNFLSAGCLVAKALGFLAGRTKNLVGGV